MELGPWALLGGTDLEDGILWDSPCLALPPFLPVLSVCPCPRACVCVYIIIYLFVCGRVLEVGRELVRARIPGGIYLSHCRTAADRGFWGAGSRGSRASPSAEPE